MRLSIATVVLLAACHFGSEEAAPEAPAADLPNQAALSFYCEAMFNLSPSVYMNVAPHERQQAVVDALTSQANEAGLAEWGAFQMKLAPLAPEERSAWFNEGIEAYGIQDACLAVRPRKSLNDEEMGKLRDQRNQLRAAAKEAAVEEAQAQ